MCRVDLVNSFYFHQKRAQKIARERRPPAFANRSLYSEVSTPLSTDDGLPIAVAEEVRRRGLVVNGDTGSAVTVRNIVMLPDVVCMIVEIVHRITRTMTGVAVSVVVSRGLLLVVSRCGTTTSNGSVKPLVVVRVR